MGELALQSLIGTGSIDRVEGDGAVRIRAVKHDSRRIEPGDLFAALPGVYSDGKLHVEAAVQAGAVAVLAEAPLAAAVPVVVARDALLALAEVARRLYDDPTDGMPVVGITGTNGKTTTAYLVEQMLLSAGHKPAVIGTVEVRGPGGCSAATHTTPMADDLMRLCRAQRDGGASELVLEVSSHGLAMRRVDGVHFAVAAFSNLSQDHLDYHGDLESYGRAKRRLFDELSPGCSVINIDDPFGRAIAGDVRGPLLTCSTRNDAAADVCVQSWHGDLCGLHAAVRTPRGPCEIDSPLIGEHNLDNLVLALGCGLALELPLSEVERGLGAATGAPGRLERVADAGLHVFVDYAHTPDALRRALTSLRKQMLASDSGTSEYQRDPRAAQREGRVPLPQNRLWVVFGAGGDRDRNKRAPMGEAAAGLADVAVLTNDNPRSEDPDAILDDIEAGVRGGRLEPLSFEELSHGAGYLLCPDRARAIGLAIQGAAEGDTVLIAGKGHETVQVIGDQRHPFDDRQHAELALRARRERR